MNSKIEQYGYAMNHKKQENAKQIYMEIKQKNERENYPKETHFISNVYKTKIAAPKTNISTITKKTKTKTKKHKFVKWLTNSLPSSTQGRCLSRKIEASFWYDHALIALCWPCSAMSHEYIQMGCVSFAQYCCTKLMLFTDPNFDTRTKNE